MLPYLLIFTEIEAGLHTRKVATLRNLGLGKWAGGGKRLRRGCRERENVCVKGTQVGEPERGKQTGEVNVRMRMGQKMETAWGENVGGQKGKWAEMERNSMASPLTPSDKI